MLIDHIIYAAPDLEAAAADIEERFGVRAAGGGRHMGQGTHNVLLALGPRTCLELIAPDPEQPEPSAPRPYGVDGVIRGHLVGWALAYDDIDGALARARAKGFDPGDVIEGHRVTTTGTRLQWRLTRNALTAGLIPFLISWGETPHPASSAPPGLLLESLHIEHPDPSSLMGPLNALGAQVEVRPASQAALVARIKGPRGRAELR
jgi:Glyoxalase-like domain